ncbi:hypothetical protein EAG_15731 [Camponotus floridanus]|uniref:Uncharacterized protein n=1 Tax=Camponotus floridanus TaxID=104421 RepID=E2AXC2_CAMFO|nr:hypothetical protein EAG_15731 [Camponotus floridanus]
MYPFARGSRVDGINNRDYQHWLSRLQILKDSMIERNEQLSELKNLFGHLEEHRSLKGYDGPKTSRSSALLSKNGTSVGESDTQLACATRPKEMRIPRNPPILFAYLPARLPILPAILRVHPRRKRLCTDYKVDIGCTSCILYDLCRGADGLGLRLSVSSAGELHLSQRCPYDGLMNLAPVTSLPVPGFFYDAKRRRREIGTLDWPLEENYTRIAARKHRLRN